MELNRKDLKHIWHPCSQMKDYETFPPIVIESGDGIYITDTKGNRYIDAISSWWVNLFGHSNQRLNDAIKRQVDAIEHVIFANFTHSPAIELGEKLAELTPGDLSKLFFASDGSSAVEISLKMAFQAHQIRGNYKKTTFIGLSGGYHGETIGAMSSVGVNKYNKHFKPLLFNSLTAQAPDCYRCEMNRKTCDASCFQSMKSLIQEHHSSVAAVIVEPMVQGAAGMKIYSKVYLQKLKALCEEYDIYLIADEIAMGFGRTGRMFACEHAEIAPDFMTLSKGLTAGYLPMSIVMTTPAIYELFYDDFENEKAFLHSHSYSGNPLACAVALESLKIFEEENIIEKNQSKSKIFEFLIREKFNTHPNIGDIRSIGMIFALELVKDTHTKDAFPSAERVGYKIYKIAVAKGLLLRPMGDVLYFMPPYVITTEEFTKMLDITENSINEYFYKR